ncbi:MAG TPA: amidohydrolase family protein [Anaerolineae bacterium]|nr:amidohydrolase family protein [Anaerolineae bacterium]
MILDFRIIGTGKEFFPGGYEALPPFMERYKQLYDFERMCTLPFEEFLGEMQKSGVSKAVLHAEYSYGDAELLNKTVAEKVKEHPNLLIGFAGLDPPSSRDPVADLDRYVKQSNMKGLNLQPWVQGWYTNDKRLYPLYSYCQDSGMPVAIHTSLNFALHRRIDYGHPLYLDEVACDFPKLTIVANHGGWPWVNDMVAVAWKRPNVYLEIGAVSPKYIARPGTGWELLMTYGNSVLQDQILFATDSLIPHERAVKELDLLPLKDTVKEKLLCHNAARLLGLAPS